MSKILVLSLLSGCFLTGCLAPKLPTFEEADSGPEPTPSPTPPPQRTPPPGPSSDEVWLAEMMTQRLELTTALAWTQFNSSSDQDNLNPLAQRRLLLEQGLRVGIPAEIAEPFFEAQLEAVSLQKAYLHKKWSNPRKQPSIGPLPELTIHNQIDAVDLQLVATIARLRGIPQSRDLYSLALERMHSRNIPRAVAKQAAAPLRP